MQTNYPMNRKENHETKQTMLLFHRIYSDILSCDATGRQDDDGDDACIIVMLIMLMPFTIMMTMMMMVRFLIL